MITIRHFFFLLILNYLRVFMTVTVISFISIFHELGNTLLNTLHSHISPAYCYVTRIYSYAIRKLLCWRIRHTPQQYYMTWSEIIIVVLLVYSSSAPNFYKHFVFVSSCNRILINIKRRAFRRPKVCLSSNDIISG